MANVNIDQGFHAIVAACAFCGRWRDSMDEWVTPPGIVTPMVEMKIIELSHTYCPACLQANANAMGGLIATEIAVRGELKKRTKRGFPYDPNDPVHNIMQTLGKPVPHARS